MNTSLNIFDALYYRFILRDFFGKIVPGFILLFSIAVSLTSLIDFKNELALMSYWFWIVSLSISWIAGLTIQAIGDYTNLIKYFPEPETFDTYYDKLLLFNKHFPSIEWQNFERLRLIMESSGYSYVSLLISLIILLIDYLFENNGVSNISFNDVVVLSVFILFILSLRKMHFIHVIRSHKYLLKLLDNQQK